VILLQEVIPGVAEMFSNLFIGSNFTGKNNSARKDANFVVSFLQYYCHSCEKISFKGVAKDL